MRSLVRLLRLLHGFRTMGRKYESSNFQNTHLNHTESGDEQQCKFCHFFHFYFLCKLKNVNFNFDQSRWVINFQVNSSPISNWLNSMRFNQVYIRMAIRDCDWLITLAIKALLNRITSLRSWLITRINGGWQLLGAFCSEIFITRMYI